MIKETNIRKDNLYKPKNLVRAFLATTSMLGVTGCTQDNLPKPETGKPSIVQQLAEQSVSEWKDLTKAEPIVVKALGIIFNFLPANKADGETLLNPERLGQEVTATIHYIADTPITPASVADSYSYIGFIPSALTLAALGEGDKEKGLKVLTNLNQAYQNIYKDIVQKVESNQLQYGSATILVPDSKELNCVVRKKQSLNGNIYNFATIKNIPFEGVNVTNSVYDDCWGKAWSISYTDAETLKPSSLNIVTNGFLYDYENSSYVTPLAGENYQKALKDQFYAAVNHEVAGHATLEAYLSKLGKSEDSFLTDDELRKFGVPESIITDPGTKYEYPLKEVLLSQVVSHGWLNKLSSGIVSGKLVLNPETSRFETSTILAK